MSINRDYIESLIYQRIFNEDKQARLLIDSQNGKIIDANIMASSLFNAAIAELKNKKILDILYINERELLLKLIKVFAGKRDFFILTLNLDPSDLSKKSIFKVYPAKIDHDNKTFLCLTFYDISSTALTPRSFMQSESAFNFLFDKSREIIFITDINGFLLDASKGALELLGFDSKYILLQKNLFKDLIENKDEISKLIEEIQINGEYEIENTIIRVNNRYVNLLLSAHLVTLRETSKDFLLIIARRQDDLSKESYSKAYEMKMGAIEQLSKGVSHEFNNILSGIIGFSELLKMHIGHDERAQSYLDKIIFSLN